MLRFILHANHQMTLRPYVERWAGKFGKNVEIVSYDELFRSARIPVCPHVFADFDRLDDDDLARAAYMWNAIREAAPEVKLLNHPLLAMQRYELLRTLYERGLNRFDVYRLTEARRPRRFPVFLRHENDHLGPATGLLHTEAELEAAIESVVKTGVSRASTLVVEYCAEPSEGSIYRKYAAMYLDGDVIPRHLMVSTDWVVKLASRIVGVTQREEEQAYLDGNPHCDWIRRVFTLARIDYGRIDYGMVGGTPQAYEINTNPTIIAAETEKLTPASEWFVAVLGSRLEKLEAATPVARAGRSVRIDRPIKRLAARVTSAVLQHVSRRQLRRPI